MASVNANLAIVNALNDAIKASDKVTAALRTSVNALNASMAGLNATTKATTQAMSQQTATASNVAGAHGAASAGVQTHATQQALLQQALDKTNRFMTRQLTSSKNQDEIWKRHSRSFGDLRKNMNDFNTILKTQNGVMAGTVSVNKAGQAAMTGRLTATQQAAAKTIFFKEQLKGLSMHLADAGKQMGWFGRTMTTTFTLPILLAGRAATDEFLRVEKEWTRMAKVMSNDEIAAAGAKNFGEIRSQIEKTVMATADMYAANRSLAVGVMADWQAMGVGIDGAQRAMGETLRVGLLGEVDTSVAQEAIRGLTAVYTRGLSSVNSYSEALGHTKVILNQVNQIENDTSLTFGQQIESLNELSGTLQQFNMTAAQGMAVLAGMTEKGIPASEATTALRYTLQRLQAPTDKAQKTLDRFGVALYDLEGNAKPGLTVLNQLASISNQLTDKEKAELFGDAFGARQVSRMTQGLNSVAEAIAQIEAGLDEISPSKLNDTAKALIASGEADMFKSGRGALMELLNDAKLVAELQAKADKELKDIQQSAPFRIEQLKQRMKQSFAGIGETLLPAMEKIMTMIEKVIAAFVKMPEPFKMAIGTMAASFALFGPALWIMGQLFSSMMLIVNLAASLIPVMKGTQLLTAAGVALNGTNAAGGGILANIAGKWMAFNALLHGNATAANAAAAANANLNATAATGGGTAAAAGAASMIDETGYLLPGGKGAKSGKTGRFISKDMVPEEYLDPSIGRERSKTTGRVLPWKQHALNPGAKRFDSVRNAFGYGKAKGAGAVIGSKHNHKIFGMSKSVDKFKSIGSSLGNIFSKSLLKIVSGFARLVGVIKNPLALLRTFVNVAKMLGGKTLIGAGIAAVLVVVGGLIKSLTANWKTFMSAAKPGVEKLKDAFSKLGKIFSKLAEPFKRLFNELSGGGGSDMKSFWKTIGEIASTVMGMVSTAVNVISTVLKPAIETVVWVLNRVVDIILLIVAVISQDWKKSLLMIKLVALEVAKGIIDGFEAIYDGILSVIQGIVDVFRMLPDSIEPGWVEDVHNKIQDLKDNDFNPLGDAIERVNNELDELNGKGTPGVMKGGVSWWGGKGGPNRGGTRNPFKMFGKWQKDVVDEAGEVGKKAGEEFNEGYASALKGRIDDIMEEIKDSAMKAFDKQAEAKIDAVDAEIEAIDAAADKEAQLQEDREYYARRNKMLRDQAVRDENYRRERALAIYEGRVDDARTLDLEHRRDVQDGNEELADMDRDRQNTLKDRERDLAKKLLDIKKENLKAQLDAQKDALEKELQALTEYTPKTVGEMNSRMNQISEVMKKAGIQWEGIGKSSGALYAEAVAKAQKELSEAGFWEAMGSEAAVQYITGAAEIAAAPPETWSAINPIVPGSFAESMSNSWRDRSRNMAAGGPVPGTGNKDSVPTMLMPGEFVMRKAAASRIGLDALSKMNSGLAPMGFGIMSSIMPGFNGVMSGALEKILGGMTAAGGTAGLPMGEIGSIGNWPARVWGKLSANTAAAIDFVKQMWGVMNVGGVGHRANKSDHPWGKALDVMVGSNMNLGNEIASWFVNNPNVFGTKYVIWRQMINSLNGQGWRMMEDRGSPTANHMDHPHISLYDKGGILKNGMLAQNKSGEDEMVLRVSHLARAMKGAAMMDLSPSIASAFNKSLVSVRGGSSDAAGVGGRGGYTYIHVDTFIGQKQWFDKMMEDHNIRVVPKKERQFGRENRRI